MTTNQTGGTTHIAVAGREAGYYFHPYRSDSFAAYFVGRDGRGRFLGDHFSEEGARRAILHRAAVR